MFLQQINISNLFLADIPYMHFVLIKPKIYNDKCNKNSNLN